MAGACVRRSSAVAVGSDRAFQEIRDNPNILLRVAHMGHVARTSVRPPRSVRHHGADPTHNEGKERGTLIPNRQESRRGKSAESARTDLQGLQALDFVKPSRPVEDTCLPHFFG